MRSSLCVKVKGTCACLLVLWIAVLLGNCPGSSGRPLLPDQNYTESSASVDNGEVSHPGGEKTDYDAKYDYKYVKDSKDIDFNYDQYFDFGTEESVTVDSKDKEKSKTYSDISEYDKIIESMMLEESKQEKKNEDSDMPLQSDMPMSDQPRLMDDFDPSLLEELFGSPGNNKYSLGGSFGNDAALSQQSSNPHRHGHGTTGRHVKMSCDPTPQQQLRKWMGPAFNDRYMSEKKPRVQSASSLADSKLLSAWEMLGDEGEEVEENVHGDFAVNKSFTRILPEDSKYLRRDHTDSEDQTKDTGSSLSRSKRALLASSGFSSKKEPKPTVPDEPWKCDSRTIWHDLGDNYYPRYIRMVECTQSRCYMSQYGCRERAFTIKVLRRLSDECLPVWSPDGATVTYEHEWVFEERAVPFCCECARIT